jgi:hypothetical protein
VVLLRGATGPASKRTDSSSGLGERTSLIHLNAVIPSYCNLFTEPVTGDSKMSEFRVSFYKTLQNASGHSSKHLQKQFDLTSDSPSGALVAAERLFDQRSLESDCIEVLQISPTSNGWGLHHS